MSADIEGNILELARELSLGIPSAESWEILSVARGLVESGWHKGEPE